MPENVVSEVVEKVEEVVEKVEEWFGFHKSGSAFLRLAKSIPLVADTISYVNGEYENLKHKNELLDGFMSGVEAGVTRVTSITYTLTKGIVPYEYMDDMAYKGLKKVEETFPTIKKPTKQIYNDCTTYTLSTISGVTEKKKMPKNICEAVKDRISSVVEADMKIAKIVNSFAHKILDKWENALDMPKSLKGKSKGKADSVVGRISELVSKTRTKMEEIAKKTAELKKEIREMGKLSLRDMYNVSEHWLSNLYKKLKVHPKNEGIVAQTWRLTQLTVVGAALCTLGVVDAILPRIKNLILNLIETAKKAIIATISYLKKEYSNSYQFLKNSLQKMVNFVKKLYSIVIKILKVIWDDIVKAKDDVSKEMSDAEVALRESVRTQESSTSTTSDRDGDHGDEHRVRSKDE